MLLHKVNSVPRCRENRAAITVALMGSKTRKPLTPEQKKDAERLRRLFDRREPKISQLDAAVQWGIGSTQGAVEQYLNGRIPLNLDVAVKFARGMPCSVKDFSPSLSEQLMLYAEAGMAEYRAAARQRKGGST